MTSWVIQRLKAFASGLRLLKTSAYRPDSLMIVTFCSPPRVRIKTAPFSSASSRAVAVLLSPISSALHTSAATNHGSPSSVFDRLPHAKIKNRNRLFLSETVSGTGWGDEDFRLMRHTISGLKPARRWSIWGWGWPAWKSGFKIVLLPLTEPFLAA